MKIKKNMVIMGRPAFCSLFQKLHLNSSSRQLDKNLYRVATVSLYDRIKLSRLRFYSYVIIDGKLISSLDTLKNIINYYPGAKIIIVNKIAGAGVEKKLNSKLFRSVTFIHGQTLLNHFISQIIKNYYQTT